MKKTIQILLIAILSVVLVIVVLFGVHLAKDILSQDNTLANSKKTNHSISKKDNNDNASNNTTQDNTNQGNNNSDEVAQNNSNSSIENNAENSIQQKANFENTTNTVSENPDIDSMTDDEVMNYYTQNMNKDDKKITEGRFKYQRGHEYSDYIRNQLKTDPDVINMPEGYVKY
ncbi:hypothetical protein BUY49_05980 [Staphylococcus devriesei]|uniref:hypothetical protein n=1 Tax=Staphylococcus devriesei TaxID=586733 RepID=UPI000E67DEA1|nr:hypothetical protein [Staphylococcus devriesei]RIL71587.1 hypothetical protein BUY49_05980 [Staphylococcus devriesei]